MLHCSASEGDLITVIIGTMTEMIDVINDNNEVVQHESREIVHAEGLPHRVSAVLLIRSDGKYMIPTASDKKVEAKFN